MSDQDFKIVGSNAELQPVAYSLGPFPILHELFVTEEALRAKESFVANSVLSCPVRIEPRNFDENGKYTQWAIVTGGSALHKDIVEFDYEPLPSSRNQEYVEQTRFSSADEARDFYINVYLKKISTFRKDDGIYGYWTATEDGRLAIRFWSGKLKIWGEDEADDEGVS